MFQKVHDLCNKNVNVILIRYCKVNHYLLWNFFSNTDILWEVYEWNFTFSFVWIAYFFTSEYDKGFGKLESIKLIKNSLLQTTKNLDKLSPNSSEIGVIHFWSDLYIFLNRMTQSGLLDMHVAGVAYLVSICWFWIWSPRRIK